MNQSNTARGNILFGTFQIILGIFLIGNSLTIGYGGWINLLPAGFGILSIIYGILRMMGRVKSTWQKPWHFALFICVFLGLIALAYFIRPKPGRAYTGALPEVTHSQNTR